MSILKAVYCVQLLEMLWATFCKFHPQKISFETVHRNFKLASHQIKLSGPFSESLTTRHVIQSCRPCLLPHQYHQ
jgi:hypothetical protein